jgi:uncharacterized protein (TIGR02147 family)
MFDQDDYKEILRDKIQELRTVRGYQKRLAEAMGVHTSFLSQILHGSAHLTPDHAGSLAEFWGLAEHEADYFISLVNLARCASKGYRRFLKNRIEFLRAQHKEITERIRKKAEIVDHSALASHYYSSWHYAAIHTLVSVPGFDTAQAISGRLGLPLAQVAAALHYLESEKILERKAGKYKVKKTDIHLPRSSPLVNNHHSNWRSYVMSRMGLHGGEGTHFTSVLGISRADFERIRELFVEASIKVRDIVGPSKEEEVFCLSFDLFPL